MNAAIVAADEQRKALREVLKTLSAETLTLPEALVRQFPPHPPGFERTRESLPARTGLTFDPIAAAESAADMTLGILFDPQRAARLVEYNARAHTLSLGELLDAALAVNAPHAVPNAQPSLSAAIRAAVHARTVEALLRLAADPQDSSEVRAICHAKLNDIKRRSDVNSPLEAYLAHRIKQFQDDPEKFVASRPIEAPPGMPIGDDEE
jgi:hypothetical protein